MAVVAAVLGILSGLIPLGIGAVLVLLAEGVRTTEVWTLVVLFTLAATSLSGAVLLLGGRSWEALAAPAGVIGGFMLVGTTLGAFGGGPYLVGVLAWLVPLTAAGLCLLPRTRAWVADRRSVRAAARRTTQEGAARATRSSGGERGGGTAH